MVDNFPRNLMKGKIAETIFWLMFRDTYFTVLPFGYEQIVPMIAKNHTDVVRNNVNVKKMRKQPDFVLIAPDKSVYTIDVKYCHDIQKHYLKEKAQEMITEWEDCFFFIASPDGFYINSCKEIAKGLDNFEPLAPQVVPEDVQNYYNDLLNEFIKAEKETSATHKLEEEDIIDSRTIGNVNFEKKIAQQVRKNYSLDRAGKPWTAIEDTDIREDFNNGRTVKEMAVEHQRSYGAIRSRLIKLGLISLNNN